MKNSKTAAGNASVSGFFAFYHHIGKKRAAVYAALSALIIELSMRSVNRPLTEVSLQQTFKRFAVSRLIAGHLMNCVVDSIQVQRFRTFS